MFELHVIYILCNTLLIYAEGEKAKKSHHDIALSRQTYSAQAPTKAILRLREAIARLH